jgi:hypothetical protein
MGFFYRKYISFPEIVAKELFCGLAEKKVR